MSTSYGSDIAPVAALWADRGRAAMLTALLDGRPLSAGELARTAGVSAATASSHLGRLLDGDLVTVVEQGRRRLKGAEVAEVIEALSRISPAVEVRSLRRLWQASALGFARSCYDHLAGRGGAALFEAMLTRDLIEAELTSFHDPARSEQVTDKGRRQLALLGIGVDEVCAARRRFAGYCLDWTERRPHLNGALGAAVLDSLIERGWFERGTARWPLVLTQNGRGGLADVFGCVVE